jgi:hypothetical protein
MSKDEEYSISPYESIQKTVFNFTSTPTKYNIHVLLHATYVCEPQETISACYLSMVSKNLILSLKNIIVSFPATIKP